ncbi:MAG: electron transport complex subunit RsxB [Gammaproteobacteria bacterium]|nr:electron transport complex subunit RsxB [Gammaproteobacteria bacterium]NNF67099.1 electron transport complex subunit RsxB [Gammaproteobacteria bacterium]
MTAAVFLLVGFTLLIVTTITVCVKALRNKDTDIEDAIEDRLPQTQCGQCGFPGCRPYAEAIHRGDADINQCPPGGTTTIRDLAQLLAVEFKPLDPEFGTESAREIAVIDEDICIGCKKCILVCPVDAIVGAAKYMHTVIASECTGCNLCPPACPVDCIDMIPAVSGINAWSVLRPLREPQRRLQN